MPHESHGVVERGRAWLVDAPRRLWNLPPSGPDRAWLSSSGGPRLLLAAAMALNIGVFSTLLVGIHSHYGTLDYDLGILDQEVWLLARGKQFITVRGLDVFGHHVTPGLWLFAPFSWLGSGPNFLNIAMVVGLTAAAIPIFRLAIRTLGNEWHALVLAVAFLMHFTNQSVLQETFHPETLAVAPLLFAWLALLDQRHRHYVLWLVLALLWKEDVALTVFAMGFVTALRGRRMAGRLTMLGAMIWFFVATSVIIPHFTPDGTFYGSFYGELGDTPSEVIATSITDTELVITQLRRADAVGYGRDLSLPFGGVGLLSPLALLISLGQALPNLLSGTVYPWDPDRHYATLVLVGITIASVEGAGRFARLGVRRFLVGWIGACALATSVAWGTSPIGRDYHNGSWALEPNPRNATLDAAVGFADSDDAVAASYYLVPHLTRRDHIYTFPNPWRSSYWGVQGEDPHDPDDIDLVIVDLSVTSPEDLPLLSALRTSPGWRVLLDQDQILVLERRPSADEPT